MVVSQAVLDELTAQAKASPRLRMNMDLRNGPEDGSQRMLNAIEPGSPLPIHRHKYTSETVMCLRGRDFPKAGLRGWLAFAACGAGAYFPRGGCPIEFGWTVPPGRVAREGFCIW